MSLVLFTSYIVYLFWFCVCVGVCVGLVGVCVFSCVLLVVLVFSLGGWAVGCVGFGLAALLFFSLLGPFGDPGASPWLVPLGLLPWRLAGAFLLSSLFLSLSLSLSLSLFLFFATRTLHCVTHIESAGIRLKLYLCI
jgi:hypothetical protein